MIGDLIYTWLAFRLAQREDRDDVTSMPLGIDTVSLFGLALIAFMPMLIVFEFPLVGLVALPLLLAVLFRRVSLPGHLSPALSIVIVTTACFYAA